MAKAFASFLDALESRVPLSTARSAMSKLVNGRYAANRRNRTIAEAEASRISAALAAGATRAVVVYDAACSPPTYGDFLYVVALSRYFLASGLALDFLIVGSEFRDDWAALGEGQAAALTREKHVLAEAFLPKSGALRIRVLAWPELQAESRGWSADCVVPFRGEVGNRMPVYVHAFNLLNHLLHAATDARVAATLFSSRDLPRPEHADFSGRAYVAWHARYSSRWAPERNITDDEFRAVHGLLAATFPGSDVLVVSDRAGCAHFREVARSSGLDALFSKDFSADFIGDAALVLGSSFYFQLRGGGMSTIGLCSLTPYLIMAPMKNEVMWSRRAATSWQTPHQRFVDAARVSHRLRRPRGLFPASGRTFGGAA